jgi:hypothetical protein
MVPSLVKKDEIKLGGAGGADGAADGNGEGEGEAIEMLAAVVGMVLFKLLPLLSIGMA